MFRFCQRSWWAPWCTVPTWKFLQKGIDLGWRRQNTIATNISSKLCGEMRCSAYFFICNQLLIIQNHLLLRFLSQTPCPAIVGWCWLLTPSSHWLAFFSFLLSNVMAKMFIRKISFWGTDGRDSLQTAHPDSDTLTHALVVRPVAVEVDRAILAPLQHSPASSAGLHVAKNLQEAWR